MRYRKYSQQVSTNKSKILVLHSCFNLFFLFVRPLFNLLFLSVLSLFNEKSDGISILKSKSISSKDKSISKSSNSVSRLISLKEKSISETSIFTASSPLPPVRHLFPRQFLDSFSGFARSSTPFFVLHSWLSLGFD